MRERKRLMYTGLVIALIFIANAMSSVLHAQQAGVLTNLEIGSNKTPIEYLRFPLDQPLSTTVFNYTATVSDQYTAKFFITATTPAGSDDQIKIDGVAVKSGEPYAVDLKAGVTNFVINVTTTEAPEAIYHLQIDRKDLTKTYTSEVLGKGIWRIYDFGGTHGDESFYLIEGKDRAMLFDVGMGKGDLAGYVKTLTKLPVAVAITHGHGDHFGQVDDFKDSDVYIGEQDITRLPHNFLTPKFHVVKDGDVIDLGGRKFEAINVPGHTIGSILYLDRADKIMATGDSISSGSMVYMFGNNCTALDQYAESLKHLEAKVKDIDGLTLLVGHHYQEKVPLTGAAAIGMITDMRKEAEAVLAGTTQGKQVWNTGFGGAKSELREANLEYAGLWYNPANMRTAPGGLGMLDITTPTGGYLSWKAVFSSLITDYTVTVPDASTTTVEVTPTAYWPTAKSITVNGAAVKSGASVPVQLAAGANKVAILVTGGDGSTKTYTVTIQK